MSLRDGSWPAWILATPFQYLIPSNTGTSWGHVCNYTPPEVPPWLHYPPLWWHAEIPGCHRSAHLGLPVILLWCRFPADSLTLSLLSYLVTGWKIVPVVILYIFGEYVKKYLCLDNFCHQSFLKDEGSYQDVLVVASVLDPKELRQGLIFIHLFCDNLHWWWANCCPNGGKCGVRVYSTDCRAVWVTQNSKADIHDTQKWVPNNGVD